VEPKTPLKLKKISTRDKKTKCNMNGSRICNLARRENFLPEFMPYPPCDCPMQKLSPTNRKVKNHKSNDEINKFVWNEYNTFRRA